MGRKIRKLWVAGAISLVGGLMTAAPAVAEETPDTGVPPTTVAAPVYKTLPQPADAEQQMLDFLNQYRLASGLKQLVRIPTLDKAALDWSTYMADGGCLDRDGAALCHRRDLALIASLASPKGWTRAGENVGRIPDGGTLAALHTAFTNSAAHRANMLNSQYNAVGVGVHISDAGMLYVTFEYISTVGTPNSGGPVVGFPQAPADATQEDAFLFYVNYLRQQAGVQPLVRQAALDREAAWWSTERANGACGEDTNLCNRKDSAAMIKATVGTGKTRWWAGAVGVTYATDASAQVSWFANSTPLRNVLLRKDANLIGIGIAKDADGLNFITISVLQVKNAAKTLPTNSTNTCGWVQANLKARAKGVAVRVAQCALAAQGVWTAPVDGLFSSDMTKVVKDFQRSVKLRATGVLDLKTRKALGIS